MNHRLQRFKIKTAIDAECFDAPKFTNRKNDRHVVFVAQSLQLLKFDTSCLKT